MWHRQSGHDCLVCPHVDHTATIVPPLAPTVGDVALTDARDIRRATRLDRQPIEMTAIFRRQLREKQQLPQRDETMPITDRRQQLGDGGEVILAAHPSGD